MELRVPPDVLRIVERLRSAGFEAYVVGGCVRDALRGVDPTDWDVATDAKPEDIQRILRRSLYTNRFGTVIVRTGVPPGGSRVPGGGSRVPPGGSSEEREVEVTTYRIEADYSDHRRPDVVAFTASLHEDLSRRDFTMNAMAWSPDGGGTIVDPFHGQRDLDARTIRAVGDPDERFHEDALRMLRAVRFAAALGFAIEPGTAEAIRRNARLADTLSGERIQQEVVKILWSPAPSVGFRMLSNLGLLAVVAPELERCRETPQEKVAAQDVFEHSLATLDAAAAMPARKPDEDLALRLAALFHDIGKPDTFGDGHFHQHEFVGEAKVRRILQRWRSDKATIEAVAHLVRHHMFWYQPDWTGSAVRRFIRNVGLETIPVLFALRKADNIGSAARSPRLRELEELWLRVQEEIQHATAFSKRDLKVNGNDVMAELGIRPGPEVGRILDALFERVLDEPELNARERLLALAREIHGAGPGRPT